MEKAGKCLLNLCLYLWYNCEFHCRWVVLKGMSLNTSAAIKNLGMSHHGFQSGVRIQGGTLAPAAHCCPGTGPCNTESSGRLFQCGSIWHSLSHCWVAIVRVGLNGIYSAPRKDGLKMHFLKNNRTSVSDCLLHNSNKCAYQRTIQEFWVKRKEVGKTNTFKSWKINPYISMKFQGSYCLHKISEVWSLWDTISAWNLNMPLFHQIIRNTMHSDFTIFWK